MIFCKTPFRISFFGGGTDLPQWYNENGGLTIAMGINKYCYLLIRNLPPFFPFKYRVRYFKNEFCKNIKDIKHKSIRHALLHYHKKNNGLEIVHSADLPAQSGLGSSSAFSVSLINSLVRFNSKKILSNYDLALLAIGLEQNILKEAVGSQDQMSCSLGGLNILNFKKTKIKVEKINHKNLNIKNMLKLSSLYFVGFPRSAETIEKEKLKNMKKNFDHFKEIHQIALEAKKYFLNPKKLKINEINRLMVESWELKKSLSKKVSNNHIDNLYNFALANGASSGKILGAGGGGFVFFLSKNENERKKLEISFKNKLTKINFEIDDAGSQIIFENKNDKFSI